MLRKRKSGSDERFLFISETEKTMLKKDSYVMKTGDGVCLVMEELCMKAPGSPAPVPYYRLQPLKDPGSSVFVPVKEHYPDIRPVLTKEEAEEILYSELALVLNISEEEVLERLRLSAEKKTCE